MSEIMIEAEGLSKKYGSFSAIDNVSFQIRSGEIVAFLGPNGAGKSTTMKVLSGYLAPTKGVARVAGFDMAKRRIKGLQHLGYLPENGPLYPEMTPKEILTFFAEARKIKASQRAERVNQVIETCSLKGVVNKPIHKLSKGYRQRVGMAHVLLHEPDVLIMDEPTSGLDPNQIRHVRDVIRELGKTKTILLSTHILQEVEAVAGRVIMINAGRIVFDGPPDELKNQGSGSIEQAFYTLTGVA